MASDAAVTVASAAAALYDPRATNETVARIADRIEKYAATYAREELRQRLPVYRCQHPDCPRFARSRAQANDEGWAAENQDYVTWYWCPEHADARRREVEEDEA